MTSWDTAPSDSSIVVIIQLSWNCHFQPKVAKHSGWDEPDSDRFAILVTARRCDVDIFHDDRVVGICSPADIRGENNEPKRGQERFWEVRLSRLTREQCGVWQKG